MYWSGRALLHLVIQGFKMPNVDPKVTLVLVWVSLEVDLEIKI